MFSFGKPVFLGVSMVKGKVFFQVAHLGAGADLSHRRLGSRRTSWQGGHGHGHSLALHLSLLHRLTSGTRMMTGCCRLWSTETRRRWPHCWARRGPAPPSMTARARPRKLKQLSFNCPFWVLTMFPGILRIPRGALQVHLWGTFGQLMPPPPRTPTPYLGVCRRIF